MLLAHFLTYFKECIFCYYTFFSSYIYHWTCHYSIKMKYVCIWSVNGSSPLAECPLHFSLLGFFESIYWFYLYYLISFPVGFLHNFHLFILLNVCATKVAHKNEEGCKQVSTDWERDEETFSFLKLFSCSLYLLGSQVVF